MDKEQYKFPDEEVEIKGKPVDDDTITFEIEDDTPPEDRNKEPMPAEKLRALESATDEEEAELAPRDQKERLQQYKKVWNDERRAKEAALREQQEAIELARRVLDENKKLKAQYSAGEKTYIETVQNQTETQVAMAKREYKEALESGDADRVVEAQSKLSEATYAAQQAKQFRPTALQEDQNEVQIQQVEQQRPRIDAKTQDWLDENPWYGTKKAMSNYAVGVHEELVDEYGKDIVGSDQYYKRIDQTMRKKFPEYFEMFREHHPNKYPFFAGNFWWAKSAHVKSLQAPKTDDKYSAEGWLGSNGLLRNVELFEGMPSLHLFQNVTF